MTTTSEAGIDLPAVLNDAFREVIEMMFGMAVDGPLDNGPGSQLNVAGMIGLAGPTFQGLLQITCTESGARQLAAALLGGEEMLEDPSMISDSLGELANMLGGAVKQRIDTSGLRVEISLPSVLEGVFNMQSVGHEDAVEHMFEVDGETILASLVYNNGPRPE